MTSRCSTDIAIFGGGVAGLWLLSCLRKLGYHAVLFEASTLGSGQTLSSQGIIHGGLKYALDGALSGASQAIATMPARWQKMLVNEISESGRAGDLDLSAVNTLSEHYYMWSDGSFRSKLKNFLGSKSLRGRVETVDAAHYPDFFAAAPANRGTLYKLPDFVIDTPSLVSSLMADNEQHIFQIDAERTHFARNAEDQLEHCEVRRGEECMELSAQRFVFAAGEGNHQLLQQAQIASIGSQTRPLHMVYLQRKDLPQVYLHCIGSDFSLTPKLTITSHPANDGLMTWYLGGELAESGVNRDRQDQLAAAQETLSQLFPWLDLANANWESFFINRAEASRSDNSRPDDFFLSEANGAIVVWPTKLTLTPALADKLIEQLKSQAVAPAVHPELVVPFPSAALGSSPWNNC